MQNPAGKTQHPVLVISPLNFCKKIQRLCLVVAPSDHIINDVETFKTLTLQALNFAKERWRFRNAWY